MSLRSKRIVLGEVVSATTSCEPVTRPSSARESLRLGRVRSSRLATVCMYSVLFFPSTLVVIPGAYSIPIHRFKVKNWSSYGNALDEKIKY